MDRDDDAIEAILARGRQTRRPPPRWLWIAAGLVAVICATAIAAVLLGDAAPTRGAVERPSSSGAGSGSGQRRDHSSRNRP